MVVDLNPFVKLLEAWKNALVSPKRIKGDEFSLESMLLVSFLLGFIYIAGYLFVYSTYDYYKEAFGMEPFLVPTVWFLCISGGILASAFLLFVGFFGYFGTRLLGKKIPYNRIEHLVFSCMFLWLVPLFVSIVIPGEEEIYALSPWFRVPTSVVVTQVVASAMAFNIFNRGLGFSKLKSTLPAMLLVPISYYIGKGSFYYPMSLLIGLNPNVELLRGETGLEYPIDVPEHVIPLSTFFALRMVFGLTMGIMFYYLRSKREKIEVVFKKLR